MDPATLTVVGLAAPGIAWLAIVLLGHRRPDEAERDVVAGRRADAAGSLGTQSGLAGRLAAVEDLRERGRALVGGHPPAATADLVDALARAGALHEDARRRVTDAARAATVIRGRRSAQSRSVLAARRTIHDADVAVRRLEDLADRVTDRAELLSGGRERVVAALEEHEARLARIAGLSETESLRLTRAAASGAPGPLEAATRAVQALRADVDGPHPSYHGLTEALAAVGAAMDRLERDVERARWEARKG